MATLDHALYPHIFAAIVAEASFPVLSCLRNTSHGVRVQVDTHLSRQLNHILLSPYPSGIELQSFDGAPLPLPLAIFRHPGGQSNTLSDQRILDRLLKHVRVADLAGRVSTEALAAFCAITPLRLVRFRPAAVGLHSLDLTAAGEVDIVIFAREPWDRLSPANGWLQAFVRRLTIVYPRTLGHKHAATSCLQSWIPWKPLWPPSEAVVLVCSWGVDGCVKSLQDDKLIETTAASARRTHTTAHLTLGGGVVALLDCLSDGRPEEREMETRKRVRALYAAMRELLREISGRSDVLGASIEPKIELVSIDGYRTTRGDAFDLETVLELWR
ncbi:unnamed protein product [Cutaneotrichosporon oleaginosum]